MQALSREKTAPNKENIPHNKPKLVTKMDFDEEEPFLNERPDESHVFTAPRGALRPENEYLDRTGMIIMLQGAPTPDLPRLIARKFARIHGWQWHDYEVLPATDSPFLVICPGILLRDRVVLRGVYRIRPGVVIRVLEWGVDLNMAYNPPPCEAWIRLIHLPLQAWNGIEIRKTTTQLGLITGLMPYGRAAGHFKYITLRLACEDPAEIPKHLMYHEGDLTTRVRVKLLHWRFYENSPYPLYPRIEENQGNPPPNQDNQQPQQQNGNNNQQNQQGSGTTTLDVSVNNYSSGSNSHAPARREAPMMQGRGCNAGDDNKGKGRESEGGQAKMVISGEEGSQKEATQKDAKNDTPKATQDQLVANQIAERKIVQIGESMRELLISPRVHKDNLREARGTEKDVFEGIFVDNRDGAQGEKTPDKDKFNASEQEKDFALNENHNDVATDISDENSDSPSGDFHLGCALGPNNANEFPIRAPKAQQVAAQNGKETLEFNYQILDKLFADGPAQQGFHFLEAQHTFLSPSASKEKEKERERELPMTPVRTAGRPKKVKGDPKKGKENTAPVRRSARAEAKASAQQGYFRQMEKGAGRIRVNDRDKLKIDFDTRKEDIDHQLAVAIIIESGLAGSDEIIAAFQKEALKDAVEKDKDLHTVLGHTANV